MQRLEVSGAVRDIYMYIYDVSRLRVNINIEDGIFIAELQAFSLKNALICSI
jgi:hypothetical protein